jgi:hypothetical protein
MKRIGLLGGVLAAAALLPAQKVCADEPCPGGLRCQVVVPVWGAKVVAGFRSSPFQRAGRGEVVEELVGILNRTESRDTYVVVVFLLDKMGPEARPALPAVVRNGERLGVFTDVADGKVKGRPMKLAREVLDALGRIAQQDGAANGVSVAPACVAGPVPCDGQALSPPRPPLPPPPPPMPVGVSPGWGR